MSHSRTSAAWSLNLETWSSSSVSNRSTISLNVLPLTTEGAGSGAALTFAVEAAVPPGAGAGGVDVVAEAPPSKEGTAGAEVALVPVDVAAGFAPRLPNRDAEPGLGAVGASAGLLASSFAGAAGAAVGMLKRLVALGASFGVDVVAVVAAPALFAGSAGLALNPNRPPAGGAA